MKTSIIIKGQQGSVSTLTGVIETYNSTKKNLQFSNVELIFKTKKEAVKALSTAYQQLKSDKEDWNNSQGSYCYAASLSYDAASASIFNTNN